MQNCKNTFLQKVYSKPIGFAGSFLNAEYLTEKFEQNLHFKVKFFGSCADKLVRVFKTPLVATRFKLDTMEKCKVLLEKQAADLVIPTGPFRSFHLTKSFKSQIKITENVRNDQKGRSF